VLPERMERAHGDGVGLVAFGFSGGSSRGLRGMG
jgi:hypothetical protein